MAYLVWVLGKGWLCVTVLLGSLTQYYIASRLSATIYGEYWVPPSEIPRVDNQTSTDNRLNNLEKDNDNNDDSLRIIRLTMLGNDPYKPYSRAEVDRMNNVGGISLCLYWAFYHLMFCTLLDGALGCEIDFPGLLFGLPPLFVPYRLYFNYPSWAMVLHGFWIVVCMCWAHTWLATNLGTISTVLVLVPLKWLWRLLTC